MAFTRAREDISGFLYVSASHNPIGHNGLKMGLGDGSVAGGEFSATLVSKFRTLATDPAELAKTADMLRASGSAEESEVYRKAAERKRKASDVYRTFEEGGQLPAGCTALVYGQPLIGREFGGKSNPDKEPLPVVWMACA